MISKFDMLITIVHFGLVMDIFKNEPIEKHEILITLDQLSNLEDLGYVKQTYNYRNLSPQKHYNLTKKGEEYYSTLDKHKLLKESHIAPNLFMRELSKEELCIYLVSSNKAIREIAKSFYDT